MDRLMKMMMEKKGEKKALAPEYKEAKGGILQDLMKEMSGMAAEDMKGGLKKVTVAAPDSDALKAGLEKAEEMVPGAEDAEGAEEMCPECEAGEHDPSMHMDESPEALKMKIKELEAKLAAKGE